MLEPELAEIRRSLLRWLSASRAQRAYQHHLASAVRTSQWFPLGYIRVEELDAADCDRRGGSPVLLDILDVQKYCRSSSSQMRSGDL